MRISFAHGFMLFWIFVRGSVAADIMVFAAASLTDALHEIEAAYEKGTNNKLFFNLGASSVLARQIEEGARADLFISADELKMNQLAEKGLIVAESRKVLLSNTLVIIVHKDNNFQLQNPEDLRRARRIALAEPTTVPAGVYARQFLESAGFWNQVKDRVVPVENVRAALAAVESANVDAGIVYKTDAAASKHVRVAFEVPETAGPKIAYPAAVLKAGKSIAPATEFLAHLHSPQCAAIFERHGFRVVQPGKRE